MRRRPCLLTTLPIRPETGGRGDGRRAPSGPKGGEPALGTSRQRCKCRGRPWGVARSAGGPGGAPVGVRPGRERCVPFRYRLLRWLSLRCPGFKLLSIFDLNLEKRRFGRCPRETVPPGVTDLAVAAEAEGSLPAGIAAGPAPPPGRRPCTAPGVAHTWGAALLGRAAVGGPRQEPPGRRAPRAVRAASITLSPCARPWAGARPHTGANRGGFVGSWVTAWVAPVLTGPAPVLAWWGRSDRLSFQKLCQGLGDPSPGCRVAPLCLAGSATQGPGRCGQLSSSRSARTRTWRGAAPAAGYRR